MKKLIIFSILGLMHTHNSFGMLTKTSLPRKIVVHKKIQSFHTSMLTRNTLGPSYCPCLPQNCTCGRKKPQKEKDITPEKTDSDRDLLKENNLLLHKIIEQNKKNNDLLRAIIKQNHLLDHRTFNNYNQLNITIDRKLKSLYDTLEKEHNIKIE